MTSKVYTRKRHSPAGIIAAGLLAGGLLTGATGAGFELAAPSPVSVVHAAAREAPSVPWPQPGQPGGGPVTSGTVAPAGGTSHPILRTAGRLAFYHLRPHVFRVRRLHILPWWLRRNH